MKEEGVTFYNRVPYIPECPLYLYTRVPLRYSDTFYTRIPYIPFYTRENIRKMLNPDFIELIVGFCLFLGNIYSIALERFGNCGSFSMKQIKSHLRNLN